MDVIRLPEGETAPADADCITLDDVSGGVRLTGTALAGGESVALTGILCDSRESAEAQGLSWATSQGVRQLYVTINAPYPSD